MLLHSAAPDKSNLKQPCFILHLRTNELRFAALSQNAQAWLHRPESGSLLKAVSYFVFVGMMQGVNLMISLRDSSDTHCAHDITVGTRITV